MNVKLTLRLATLDDGPMLLEWRNDRATREASHTAGVVELPNHMEWLEKTLLNPNRSLFVAENSGVAVGTVRADFDGFETELSWTVAPEARGNGFAKTMILLAMEQVAGPFKAEVKKDNEASLRVAAGIGLLVEKEIDGIVYFRS